MSIVEEVEQAAGAAVNPYALAIKLGLMAVAAICCVGAGWWLHGSFDGTKVALTETKVANCQTARATDTANANGTAAQDLGQGVVKSNQADASTAKKSNNRAKGYAQAQQEADHVPFNPKPKLCVDPEPLRQLFIGLRNTDAGAGPGGADRGDASAAAVH